jgi:hypothetical protein
MVGNLNEWVADWADRADIDHCVDWTTATQTLIPGGDFSCFGGDGNPIGTFNLLPGALFRGGFWGDGAVAGVFAVTAHFVPIEEDPALGFRCAR